MSGQETGSGPRPNSDDLLRAAAWLDEQADEADAVAGTLSAGGQGTTQEGHRTRKTAEWLRDQATTKAER